MKKFRSLFIAATVTAFVGFSNPVTAQTTDNTTTSTTTTEEMREDNDFPWGLLGLLGLIGLFGRKKDDTHVHTTSTTARRDQ
ncbi:MAG: WGxxGxxG family protein [Chitinophagaceae bacterium]